MSSGLATVRTTIKTVLDTVSGIGATFDYFRGTQDMTEAERDALLTSVGIFHCWFISMASEAPYVTKRFPASHERATYGFELHGYYAVNEANASEKTFALLVERIIAAFRAAKPGPVGVAFTGIVDEQGPLQWVTNEYRVFCGVSCHYARLYLPAYEQTEP